MPMPILLLTVVVALTAAMAACTTPGTDDEIADQSILQVPIAGTSNGRLSGGGGDEVTKLFDVTGDWEQVSVELARVVRREGWTVERLNCVGSGNDVIAKKLVDGRWLLVESGAGERGAGIIVRVAPDQISPQPLSVTGPCPEALIRAAG